MKAAILLFTLTGGMLSLALPCEAMSLDKLRAKTPIYQADSAKGPTDLAECIFKPYRSQGGEFRLDQMDLTNPSAGYEIVHTLPTATWVYNGLIKIDGSGTGSHVSVRSGVIGSKDPFKFVTQIKGCIG